MSQLIRALAIIFLLGNFHAMMTTMSGAALATAILSTALCATFLAREDVR